MYIINTHYSFTILLVFISYKKRHWFYTQPVQQNPYRTVYKVLNFARKNKYPLQRSAFTYCDNCPPSRIDFAKERYGGPYTTEQVENVKTLLRVLLLLISLGPVYVLQVPSSLYVFPLFGYHIGHQYAKEQALLKAVENGLLVPLTTNLLFPLYIWYVYLFRRNRIPKMLSYLKLGTFLSLLFLLFTSAVGLLGFGLFSLTAKYFKYRKRDDNNFNQADVEEVFTRYLSQTASINSSGNDTED